MRNEAVFGVLLGVGLRTDQRVPFGLRVLLRDSRAEPSDHESKEGVVRIDANLQRRPKFRGLGEPKAGRQHADDGVGNAIHHDRLSRHVRIRAKTLAP